VAKRLDGSSIKMKLGTQVGLGPWPLCIRWRPSSPPQRGTAPVFRPISVVAKWLDGLRCHLAWRYQLPFPKRARSPSIFGPCLLCPNGWMDQDGTWHGGGPGHNALDGDPDPSPKRGQSSPPPIFGPFLLWPNGWMHQDATWYGGRPQPRRLFVRWGPSSPSQKGAKPPIFCPCLLWPNGWMDQDATSYGGRPRPRRHCVRWEPSSPPLKGHSPQFSANVRCGQNGWMETDGLRCHLVWRQATVADLLASWSQQRNGIWSRAGL